MSHFCFFPRTIAFLLSFFFALSLFVLFFLHAFAFFALFFCAFALLVVFFLQAITFVALLLFSSSFSLRFCFFTLSLFAFFFLCFFAFFALFFLCAFVLVFASRSPAQTTKKHLVSPLGATEPDRNRISSGIYRKTATSIHT